MQTNCLACGGAELAAVADLGQSPVLTGALFEDRMSARDAVCGRLKLSACHSCGHVQNVAFDSTLVQYDVNYDNSLHFSGTFQQFADELVRRLIDEYDIRKKHVVEIGSGKGDFLAALADKGGNTGIGFDPTVAPDTAIDGVTLVQDYFRPGQSVAKYDLLTCRHVLEHLDYPASLLHSLSSTAPSDALFYFEVPSAEFNFGPDGLWDCIYPHVSYFSVDSLGTLLRRTGFEIISLERSFFGQFLSVIARAGSDPERHVDTADEATSVNKHLELVDAFSHRHTAAVAHWTAEIAKLREHGDTVAVWGIGSKGVNFLSAIDPDGTLPAIDVNPRKRGKFLPLTGHEIRSPESLAGQGIAIVAITNPVYQSEIARQLAELGVAAEIVVV